LVLDSAVVRDLAGDLYYKRGADYHRRGLVIEIAIEGMSAQARVLGTRTYRVRAELGRDGLTAQCSCPLGRDGEFCKHAVATVLEWLEMAGDEPPAAEVDMKPAAGLPDDWPGPESDAGPDGLDANLAAAGQRRDAQLAAFLATQPREWLVERLLLVAGRDPKLRAEWETLASRGSSAGVDLAGFRRQLTLTLTPSRDFEWDDAWDYVAGAQEILGSIDTFTEEGLAAAAVELAEVLSKDLATADRFLRIATVLSADGQFDEALRWLREAGKEFPERYDQRVGHATAEILRRAGRSAEAADVEWECFQARPSLPTYQRFAEHLRPLPDWDQWRARAVGLLERPAASGPWPGGEVHAGQGNTQLVDVLLWEGETETAWAAAERGGCDRGAWLRLARARAATYPAASIPILVREIDLARSGASDRRAYGAVAGLVRELGTWHQRAGTDDAYRTYALRLRQEHRNRPAFQDELNLAGVPRL